MPTTKGSASTTPEFSIGEIIERCILAHSNHYMEDHTMITLRSNLQYTKAATVSTSNPTTSTPAQSSNSTQLKEEPSLLAMTVCPFCHQPTKTYFRPRRWKEGTVAGRMVAALTKAGDKGLTWVELREEVYGASKEKAKGTIVSHIWQINQCLKSRDMKIVNHDHSWMSLGHYRIIHVPNP
jgi:hypothetical protein